MHVDNTSQRLQTSNILEYVYKKSVILVVELSSAEMQAIVFNNYGNFSPLLKTFKIVWKNLVTNKNRLLNPDD